MREREGGMDEELGRGDGCCCVLGLVTLLLQLEKGRAGGLKCAGLLHGYMATWQEAAI